MRIVKILALVLVVAVLIGGWMYMNKLEAQDNARIQNLYAQAEPLERQKQELTEQRDALPAQYALEFRDYATMQILFPKMEYQIYPSAYPLMREKNITGIVGISPSTYPDSWNTLKKDELKSLLADGWGMCMVNEYSWGDWNYFFQTVESLCAAYEIPVPTSIYYPNNDYKAEDDAILKEHGIKTVIVNASDGRSSTVTDVTGDLWMTGAMPWSYTGSDIDMQLLARTDGANLTYVMSFSDTWADQKTGASRNTQEEANFKTFLESVKSMMFYESPLDNLEQVASASSIFVDTQDQQQLYELYLQELTPDQQVLLPRFRLADYDAAREFHLQALDNSQAKKAELDEEVAKLDAQIADIDRQLDEIYAQWDAASKR